MEGITCSILSMATIAAGCLARFSGGWWFSCWCSGSRCCFCCSLSLWVLNWCSRRPLLRWKCWHLHVGFFRRLLYWLYIFITSMQYMRWKWHETTVNIVNVGKDRNKSHWESEVEEEHRPCWRWCIFCSCRSGHLTTTLLSASAAVAVVRHHFLLVSLIARQ